MTRPRLYWAREGPLDESWGRWHRVDEETWNSIDSSKTATRTMRVSVCGVPFNAINWVEDDPAGSNWILTHRARLCLDCLDEMGGE